MSCYSIRLPQKIYRRAQVVRGSKRQKRLATYCIAQNFFTSGITRIIRSNAIVAFKTVFNEDIFCMYQRSGGRRQFNCSTQSRGTQSTWKTALSTSSRLLPEIEGQTPCPSEERLPPRKLLLRGIIRLL